ncbi:MAG: AsmA-like C-terminal region-containing protein [Candidatus Omnitrophota bacterium]
MLRKIPFLYKLFFSLTILTGICALAIWYINKDILPIKGRAFVIKYLTEATGREVNLESLCYNPFRGIILKNITVFDDPKYNRPFLSIKRLYLNFQYLPILKENKFIIPLIKVDSPKLILTIDGENKWNFESLSFLQGKNTTQRQKVFVYKVSVSNADCVFEDRALEPIFSKEIKNTDLEASIAYPFKIKYKLTSELAIKQKNSISAEGEFKPLNKTLDLTLQLKNIPLGEFQPYYTGLPFRSLRGNLSGRFDAAFTPENSLTIETMSAITNFDLNNENFSLKSAMNLSGKMTVDLKDKAKTACEISAASKIDNIDLKTRDFSLKGGLDANGKIYFDLKDMTALKYSANILLRQLTLNGIPTLGAVEKLNGKLYLNEVALWADSLKGTSRGLEIEFSGSLKDYDKPRLDLTAKTELPLERLNEFVSSNLNENLKGCQITGKSKTSLNINGLLYEKTPLDYTLSSEFSNCSIKTGALEKPVTSLSGILVSKADSIDLKDVSGEFDAKTYKLNGKITNLEAPDFDIALSSDDLRLKTEFHPSNDLVTFKKLEGRYKNTEFALSGSFADFKNPLLDIRGNISTSADELKKYLSSENADLLNKAGLSGPILARFSFNGRWRDLKTWKINFDDLECESGNSKIHIAGSISDIKDPDLDINGSLATDINELKKYIPKKSADLLNNLEAGGAVSAKFSFSGKNKDRKTWKINVKAESPQIQVKKLKFDDCYAELNFKDDFISIPKITARPYEGELAANFAIDFNHEKPQYVIELDLKNIDISKWKNDTGFKDKDLRGLFFASAQFGGLLNDLNTLNGKGQFAIADGKLWELPVFAGLANILYIPGVTKITFNEAKGSFTMGNRNIATDDTQMHAAQMDLTYGGSVDFDGGLALHITADFAKELLEGPTLLGPLRDLLVDQGGRFIGDIKLSGTLKEPKFSVKPFPIEKILQNKLFNTIKDRLLGGGAE